MKPRWWASVALFTSSTARIITPCSTSNEAFPTERLQPKLILPQKTFLKYPLGTSRLTIFFRSTATTAAAPPPETAISLVQDEKQLDEDCFSAAVTLLPERCGTALASN